MGKQWKQCQSFIFLGSKITADGDFSHKIKRRLLLGRKVMTNLDSIFKSRDITLPAKVCLMYGCESGLWRKLSAEELMLLNCGVEKTLESPLDCKEIQPVHPKGDQSWIFIGRTYAEADTPILWPLDVKNWLVWKDPDLGKIEGGRRRGRQRMKMVRWHHRLNGHELD